MAVQSRSFLVLEGLDTFSDAVQCSAKISEGYGVSRIDLLAKGSSKFAIVRCLLVLMIAVGVVGLGVAQEGKKKPKTLPPPPADLPGHVNYLAQQLYGVPLDEAGPVTDQIQKLVLDHLQQWLADRPRSDVEARRELESIFSKLHYPLFGQPAVFHRPWRGGVVIGAGYTLGWTDYDRVNVLALFDRRDGKTRLAAVSNFVPRTDLHYEFLPALGSDAFRFFVYGWRLGKSQLRLTAILYAFDGQSLKPLWETHDVYDGKMDVGPDKVVIRYLKEDEYVREVAHRRKPPRHEAIYKLTSQGLELEADHEIPF